MLYPEYPSYSEIEKRIQSFASDWIYPSGSRLSNQMMAGAGFFNMGGGSVCCYYCGNKLQSFEPRYFVDVVLKIVAYLHLNLVIVHSKSMPHFIPFVILSNTYAVLIISTESFWNVGEVS